MTYDIVIIKIYMTHLLLGASSLSAYPFGSVWDAKEKSIAVQMILIATMLIKCLLARTKGNTLMF